MLGVAVSLHHQDDPRLVASQSRVVQRLANGFFPVWSVLDLDRVGLRDKVAARTVLKSDLDLSSVGFLRFEDVAGFTFGLQGL